MLCPAKTPDMPPGVCQDSCSFYSAAFSTNLLLLKLSIPHAPKLKKHSAAVGNYQLSRHRFFINFPKILLVKWACHLCRTETGRGLLTLLASLVDPAKNHQASPAAGLPANPVAEHRHRHCAD